MKPDLNAAHSTAISGIKNLPVGGNKDVEKAAQQIRQTVYRGGNAGTIALFLIAYEIAERMKGEVKVV